MASAQTSQLSKKPSIALQRRRLVDPRRRLHRIRARRGSHRRATSGTTWSSARTRDRRRRSSTSPPDDERSPRHALLTPSSQQRASSPRNHSLNESVWVQIQANSGGSSAGEVWRRSARHSATAAQQQHSSSVGAAILAAEAAAPTFRTSSERSRGGCRASSSIRCPGTRGAAC